MVGYAGLLDLGYVGFYAVGAYTVGDPDRRSTRNWPFLLAPSRSRSLAAMVSGVLLGAPTLRVRGDYLAIVTLGFGEIIRLIAVNSEWLGDARGITNIAAPAEHRRSFEIPHLNWDSGTPLLDFDDTTTFLEFGVLRPDPVLLAGA